MRTKSIAIWLLTSITFISVVHLIEAITYPYGNLLVNSFTPTTYLHVTTTATAVLWAATCLVAFNNPVESYVNKRVQSEERIIQDREALLDRMCETVDSDHRTLTRLSDTIRKMQKGEATKNLQQHRRFQATSS
jgi:hypothetical protein